MPFLIIFQKVPRFFKIQFIIILNNKIKFIHNDKEIDDLNGWDGLEYIPNEFLDSQGLTHKVREELKIDLNQVLELHSMSFSSGIRNFIKML